MVAVTGIVDHEDEQVSAMLDGGGEFLAVHQETAVTGQRDDPPIRMA